MKVDRVIDTNVLSFLFRQDSRAEAYLPYLGNKAIAISFQTLAELELWALVGHWGSSVRPS
jgi:tRNA(fMet)-specific endonuclease VapC